MMNNRNLIIYVLFIPVTVVLSYYALVTAHIGWLHYFSFILGAILVYDAFKTYRELKHVRMDMIFEVMIGTFMVSEHIYLFQEFLKGTINF